MPETNGGPHYAFHLFLTSKAFLRLFRLMSEAITRLLLII